MSACIINRGVDGCSGDDFRKCEHLKFEEKMLVTA